MIRQARVAPDVLFRSRVRLGDSMATWRRSLVQATTQRSQTQAIGLEIREQTTQALALRVVSFIFAAEGEDGATAKWGAIALQQSAVGRESRLET
jgi:hypothetical protein